MVKWVWMIGYLNLWGDQYVNILALHTAYYHEDVICHHPSVLYQAGEVVYEEIGAPLTFQY